MTSRARFRDWLSSLFGRHADGPQRWVVVDTETSGLDPARAALLAIGGIAVDDAGIRIADSFEVVLRHEEPVTTESVVIHGIGREAQQGGVPPHEALAAFARYVSGAPCVGFHTAFDRTVLERAFAAHGALRAPERWLDLAELAATLFPDQHKRKLRSLDDWLTRFGIETTARHTAAGDAFATAELLLTLRSLAAAEGRRGFASLVAFSRHHRWL